MNSAIYALMKNVEEDSFERIAERLEWLRNHYKMSQTQFAESIGASKTQYNNWKQARQRLSLDSALRINQSYGTSLDFLFLGRLETLPDHLRKSWVEKDLDSSSR